MSDASSIRKASTFPAATGRNAGSIRFDTTINRPKYSDGTLWKRLDEQATKGNAITVTAAAAAHQITQTIFTAPRNCVIKRIKEVHATACSDAGATVVVWKSTGTQAPGVGNAVTTIATDGTANTVVSGTLAADYVSLAAGDRLTMTFVGGVTALAGFVLTVYFEEEYVGANDAVTYVNIVAPVNGDNVDRNVFVVPVACKLVGVTEVHGTAGSNAGAVTLQIKKNGTSGTAQLSAALSLKTAINTPQSGALVTTEGATTFAPGDLVTFDHTGTITALAGVNVVLTFVPIVEEVSFIGGFQLAAADMIDEALFIAPVYTEVRYVMEAHGTATTNPAKMSLVNDTSTNAPGAGTDMLTNNSNAGFDVNGTADTTQDGALSATRTVAGLPVGNRLSVDYGASTAGGAKMALGAAVVFVQV